jgi:hypothetical protein
MPSLLRGIILALAALCANCARYECLIRNCYKTPEVDQAAVNAALAERRRAEATEAEQRRQKLERRWQEWQSKPQWATARPMGILVPYAFVCNDYQSVELAWRLHSAYHQAKLQDRLSQGKSVQYRGEVTEPRTEAIGCTKVAFGTRLLIKAATPFLVVELKQQGKKRSGITSPAMVEFDEKPPSSFDR